MTIHIGRRQFISALGSAAVAWPLAAHAQLSRPVVGFLGSQSSQSIANLVSAFRAGLADGGYFEDRNVAIEYRWADGHFDRLPALAVELVRRHVDVLVAVGGNASALAASAAASNIPIVFTGVDDPTKLGLVRSLNRPGGTATGIALFNAVLAAKRLGLLRELVPGATEVAFLVNPDNPSADRQLIDVQEAARTTGQQIAILTARNEAEIDAAFAAIVPHGTNAVLLGTDPLFQLRVGQIVQLAARRAMPTMYFQRESVEAGGLISYGVHFADNFRQAGIYTARILNGEKPAALPVVQPTKFELVINLKTAKSLGLEMPPTLLTVADEVIE
jgi:putative ABC transport system substrate-binding protein